MERDIDMGMDSTMGTDVDTLTLGMSMDDMDMKIFCVETRWWRPYLPFSS